MKPGREAGSRGGTQSCPRCYGEGTSGIKPDGKMLTLSGKVRQRRTEMLSHKVERNLPKRRIEDMRRVSAGAV